MPEADYRLMTEATGQRIAAALENLAGFGAYLTTADVVNSLTNTATDKPGSANMLRVLNEKLGYWTVSDTNTLTANYVTYNARSGRKFSDYYMLAITPDFGGWWTNGLVIPLSNFIGATGVALFYYDGSERIEIDVKYVSDTSFQAKYIGNPTSSIHVNIFGFMPST